MRLAVDQFGVGKRRARPRIGIYEASPGPGGPSRYVESLLAGIDPAEFDIVLFCRKGGPYRPRGNVQMQDVAVENPGSPEKALPAATVARSSSGIVPGCVRLWGGFGRESARLAACFKRRPVDLLHTNNAGCEESAVAARLAGIPRVLGTFHVDSTYDLAQRRSGLGHRVLEFVSNHCLDAAIAVSDATGRNWMRRTRLSPRRMVTIHNGIDPAGCRRALSRAEARRRLGLPEDALIVGGVGRLDDAKGFGALLEATAMLAAGYPKLIVALAGEGPLRRKLEEQAARLGIGGRVHFLGFCAAVRDVYPALDIFAMPSRCEALPYALLEAMAAELPAVGSEVGGVPEVIVPGETGILAPVGDCRALAAGMKALLDDEDLRRRMGRAGRERVVREFSEREMVARTIEVYRRMLSGGSLFGNSAGRHAHARSDETLRNARLVAGEGMAPGLEFGVESDEKINRRDSFAEVA